MGGYDVMLSLPANAASPASARLPVVAPYTPQWHARRVLKTSAAEWWEGGVPPARGRRQRAARALSCAMQVATHAATGMAQRLHLPRQAG